ncbi:MAG: DUF885 domain-containing protein [Streptosporangiaceae bacterium]
MISIAELSDRYVTELAAADPCLAAFMGIAGQDENLTDYGPEGFAVRRVLARRTLDELADVEAGDAAERRAVQVLRDRLQVDLALADAGIPDAHVSVINGPFQNLRMAVEVLDQGVDTPRAALASRVAAFPAALRSVRSSLVRARDEGRVSARRQILLTAGQCGPTGEFLLGLEAPGSAAAARACAEFGAFLTRELAPVAPERDAVGPERYALETRHQLGMDLDFEETYAWGWAELARIEAEMVATAGQILPGASVAAVTAALDADPKYRIRGKEAFREWIQELADRAIADLSGTHFDLPEALLAIDCRIPPTDGGIYYLAPTEDLRRPGQVWYTFHGEEMITWAVPAIMFHEGVPGHHLQLGMTVMNQELTRFQRICSEVHPGHAEGWGLYAERLMDELGYYADPAHRLGMLAGGQQIRAARVVLDIGLHLELEIPRGTGFHEGERWTRDLGVEFLRLHSGPEDDSVIEFEIDRYLGMPGQALAYKVGERVWLEARAAAQARLGSVFDLKAFHSESLGLGPMGLDLLRTELAAGLPS